MQFGRIASKYCPLICFLLTSVAIIHGQENRTVQGTVFDSSGVPISNASIEFRSATRTSLTTTDDKGSFVISDVTDAGRLRVSHSGFAPVVVEVSSTSIGGPL